MTMTLQNSILPSLVFSWALCLASLPLHAQEEQQVPTGERPKPAGASSNPFPFPNAGDQDQGNESGMGPDLTPLTGVQSPTLGSPEVRHSYWQPGLQWSGAIQSIPYNQTPSSGWVMNNFFAGTLNLLQASSHSQFALNYTAGGYVSSDSTQGNDYYQQLVFSETLQWKRLSVLLLDQFSYLPQSSFGFGGGTGLGTPGTGGSLGPIIPGAGNSYIPNQSIFAAVGSRYSNASSLQLTYMTSRRGSITVSGTYGLLDFVEAGNYDNVTITGTAGYNYATSRKDTIGAFYSFSSLHFPDQPTAYGVHTANAAYGRKVTGRLALQIFGGPSITTTRPVPPAGSPAGTPPVPIPTTHGENVGANVTYGVKRGGFSVGYNHGVFGGAGVLIGSVGDTLTFSANHMLGRIWSGQINGGYSHNAAINSASHSPLPGYNTWNVGAGVTRAVGRNATFGLAYNATFTDYGLAGCVGSACSANQTFQYVTINFQWRAKPFVLP